MNSRFQSATPEQRKAWAKRKAKKSTRNQRTINAMVAAAVHKADRR